MIDNSGHNGSSETEFRVYSYFVWMSKEMTKVCSSALFLTTWSWFQADLLTQCGTSVAALLTSFFPKSHTTALFTEITSQRWDLSEEVTKKESPGAGPVKHFTADRRGRQSEYLGHRAVPTLGMSARMWAQLLMLPVVRKRCEVMESVFSQSSFIFAGMETN